METGKTYTHVFCDTEIRKYLFEWICVMSSKYTKFNVNRTCWLNSAIKEYITEKYISLIHPAPYAKYFKANVIFLRLISINNYYFQAKNAFLFGKISQPQVLIKIY